MSLDVADAKAGSAQIKLSSSASSDSGSLEGLREYALESASAPAFGTNITPLLVIAWQVLEPRQIASLAIARLHVSFEFSATPQAQRQEFMQHFDLSMQRGGG